MLVMVLAELQHKSVSTTATVDSSPCQEAKLTTSKTSMTGLTAKQEVGLSSKSTARKFKPKPQHQY